MDLFIRLFKGRPKRLMEGVKSSEKMAMVILAIVLFFLFSMLFLQFYRVQVIEHEKWEQMAQRQHEWVIKVPFKRGGFYAHTSLREHHPDRSHPLVIDVPKYHLFCDPSVISPEFKENVAKNLWHFLSLPEEDEQSFHAQFFFKSRSRRLASWLEKEEKESIESWWYSWARKNKLPRNALFFIKDYQRSYPHDHLLGQVLHTIRDFKDEHTKQGIPTGGLELQFNDYLMGSEGRRWFLRSLRHPLKVGGVIKEAVDGADIYLTINHILQAMVEEELEKGIKRAGAKGGFALVMNPDNGQVLALAQYPFFSPAAYKDYFNDTDKVQHTKVKAVMDAYEPGSTFKPIVLAVCLLANEELQKRGQPPLFSPDDKIPTSSGVFPGRGKPLKDGRVHKYLNMDLALQKSSNIYMAVLIDRLVQRMGEQWLKKTLETTFHFGRDTGIELPLENPGILPTPGKRYANGLLEWSKATPYSLAMGHNIQANGLQMLCAFSTLVNGGYWVKPTLVKKISQVDPYGKEQLLYKPEIVKEKVLSEAITERVLQSMKYVTKFGGTATRGDIKGYTEVGKTGTAYKIIDGRYNDNHYFSSFVGATPVKGPKVAILIAVDEPEKKFIPGVGKNHHGGVCAAPIFREIAKQSLDFLGIAPDDPHGYPRHDPRYDYQKADWLEEVFNLRKVYEKWNE